MPLPFAEKMRLVREYDRAKKENRPARSLEELDALDNKHVAPVAVSKPEKKKRKRNVHCHSTPQCISYDRPDRSAPKERKERKPRKERKVGPKKARKISLSRKQQDNLTLNQIREVKNNPDKYTKKTYSEMFPTELKMPANFHRVPPGYKPSKKTKLTIPKTFHRIPPKKKTAVDVLSDEFLP